MSYEVWGEPDEHDCRSCEGLIGERDEAQEMADALAYGIAAFLGIEIGEHVGGNPGNCPWQNALEAILSAKDTHGIYRLVQHGETCGCTDCT